MHRRHFTGTLLTAAGGLALAPRGLWSASLPGRPGNGKPPKSPDLRIDGPRLNRSLEALALSGGEWGGPNRRVAYSDADRMGGTWSGSGWNRWVFPPGSTQQGISWAPFRGACRDWPR